MVAVCDCSIRRTRHPVCRASPSARARALDTHVDLPSPQARAASEDWRDGDGIERPGIAVDFVVTVKNPHKRTGYRWFGIEQSDWFATDLAPAKQRWLDRVASADAHRTILGTRRLPKRTSTVKFTLLFATAFDPHYRPYKAVVPERPTLPPREDWPPARMAASRICRRA